MPPAPGPVLHNLAQNPADTLSGHIQTAYQTPMKQRVYDFLGQSPIAAISERMTLGEGCAVSIWENTRDRVSYIAPADHTFSLYLKGGAGTRRVDAGNDRGFPMTVMQGV